MEIHMCAVCACFMGGRGWERREVAALAPWRDEKPSKPGEEENTGRAEVKLPRPSEKEREENLPNFFFYPRADCVCGQTADLVWKLWVTVYEMYIQTFKLLGNLWKAARLQWPGFVFCISLYVESDRISCHVSSTVLFISQKYCMM